MVISISAMKCKGWSSRLWEQTVFQFRRNSRLQIRRYLSSDCLDLIPRQLHYSLSVYAGETVDWEDHAQMLASFPYLRYLLPLLVSQAVVLGQGTSSRMLLCCIVKKYVPSSLQKSLLLIYIHLISIHNVSQVTLSPRKPDLWLST